MRGSLLVEGLGPGGNASALRLREDKGTPIIPQLKG